MATIEDVLSARPVAPESLLGAIQNEFDLLFASSCSKLSRDAQSLIHAPSPVQVKAPEPRRPQDQQGPSPSPLAATPLHSIKKYRCGEPFSNAVVSVNSSSRFGRLRRVPPYLSHGRPDRVQQVVDQQRDDISVLSIDTDATIDPRSSGSEGSDSSSDVSSSRFGRKRRHPQDPSHMRADRVERVVGARLGSSFDEGGGGDDGGGPPSQVVSRPRGRRPAGMLWDRQAGCWITAKVSTTAGVDLEGGPVARGGIQEAVADRGGQARRKLSKSFDSMSVLECLPTAGAVGNDKKVKKLRRREEEEKEGEEGKCAKNQLSEQRDTHRGASNSTTSKAFAAVAPKAATGATNMAKQSVSSKEKRRNVRALKQQLPSAVVVRRSARHAGKEAKLQAAASKNAFHFFPSGESEETNHDEETEDDEGEEERNEERSKAPLRGSDSDDDTSALELYLSDDGSGGRSGDDDENEERVSRLGGVPSRTLGYTPKPAHMLLVPSVPVGVLIARRPPPRPPIIAATELLASEGAKMAVTAMRIGNPKVAASRPSSLSALKSVFNSPVGRKCGTAKSDGDCSSEENGAKYGFGGGLGGHHSFVLL